MDLKKRSCLDWQPKIKTSLSKRIYFRFRHSTVGAQIFSSNRKHNHFDLLKFQEKNNCQPNSLISFADASYRNYHIGNHGGPTSDETNQLLQISLQEIN